MISKVINLYLSYYKWLNHKYDYKNHYFLENSNLKAKDL